MAAVKMTDPPLPSLSLPPLSPFLLLLPRVSPFPFISKLLRSHAYISLVSSSLVLPFLWSLPDSTLLLVFSYFYVFYFLRFLSLYFSLHLFLPKCLPILFSLSFFLFMLLPFASFLPFFPLVSPLLLLRYCLFSPIAVLSSFPSYNSSSSHISCFISLIF